MNLVKKAAYLLHKGIDFTLNPKLIQVRATGAVADTYMRLNQPWLQDSNIDTVLDIGANVGRFALTSRFLFPAAKIIAFEPLPDCFEKTMSLMKGDKNFIAYNIGLGDETSEMNIQKSSHDPSSSFLEMSNTHKEAFPFTATGSSEVNVKVLKLDDVCKSIILGENIFIKVDVQGFEDKVLKGGIKTFSRAKVLFLELSYEELYKKQPLFDDIYQVLISLGFTFRGTYAQMPHPKDGRFLDADCIFIKK